MKTCVDCKACKPLTDFHPRNKEKTKHQSMCKECQKVYRNRHYHNNKQPYLDRVRHTREANRLKLNELLCSSSCVDCGEHDPVVLEFDHVRGKKKANVSHLVQFNSWGTVLKEIAKCEIRCANCHRKKTAKQRGWSILGRLPRNRTPS